MFFERCKFLLMVCLVANTQLVFGWTNGQSGNDVTDEVRECQSPPYSTHDWIAEKALSMLPAEERQWIEAQKTLYLLGTEAPDNDKIPIECNAPNTGYDDRNKGHGVRWNSKHTNFSMRLNGKLRNRAARRAREEYEKAANAFKNGNLAHAAYYLGAMAHYIGDVSQFGHTIRGEKNHHNYELWVGEQTNSFNSQTFDAYIQYDGPVYRKPFTAVKRVSRLTSKGEGKILSARDMDSKFKTEKETQVYLDSVGNSLNLAINELADVLHGFNMSAKPR